VFLWADEMNMKEIVIVDLFSGIGGFPMGFLLAGFRFIKHFFSEVEENGKTMYKLRFPGAIGLGDIKKIKWEELGSVDILTGGFPCQLPATELLGLKD